MMHRYISFILFLQTIKLNDVFRKRILANNGNLSKDYEQHKLEMLRRMEQFTTTTSCRRYLILSYFDSSVKHPEVPVPDCCDNCSKRLQMESDPKYNHNEAEHLLDFGNEAGKLFRTLEFFNGRSGLNKPIDFLRGSENVTKFYKLVNHFLPKIFRNRC